MVKEWTKKCFESKLHLNNYNPNCGLVVIHKDVVTGVQRSVELVMTAHVSGQNRPLLARLVKMDQSTYYRADDRSLIVRIFWMYFVDAYYAHTN